MPTGRVAKSVEVLWRERPKFCIFWGPFRKAGCRENKQENSLAAILLSWDLFPS